MKKITQILQNGGTSNSDFLRDSLSIGLVRIVNAVTDSKQDKGPEERKLSMAEVARDMGFPVKAVQLRNTIAHSQITP